MISTFGRCAQQEQARTVIVARVSNVDERVMAQDGMRLEGSGSSWNRLLLRDCDDLQSSNSIADLPGRLDKAVVQTRKRGTPRDLVKASQYDSVPQERLNLG